MNYINGFLKGMVLIAIIIFTNGVKAQSVKPGGDRPAGNISPEARAAMMNQRIGVLKGRIIDAESKTPLEYTNIAIYKKRDSSLVDGTVTDAKGNFILEKLPFGRFYAMISFIGYPTRTVDSIFITPRETEVNLGTIRLKSSGKTLQGVEITEKKSVMEYNLDKKVYNVEQNVVSAGGTAIDIMQTIPAVQVDIDGNVSLRGSGNVTILVDGKPSMLTSLDQLPASMIERVEIVTNPSARYDPDGTTGIINIILKRNKALGINGMISANAGTGDKYNASFNINYRVKKWNLFTSYDFRQFGGTGTSDLFRETTINDTSSYLTQTGNNRRRGNFHNFGLGVDFMPDNYNSFTLSGRYNTRDFTMRENMDNLYQNYLMDTTQFFNRKSSGDNNNSGFELSFNYTRKFDEKWKEWTADAFYSDGSGDNSNIIDQWMYPNNPSINPFLIRQQTLSNNTRRVLTAQTDYVSQLWSGRIELGYKFSYNFNDSDYGFYNFNDSTWLIDPTKSNRYVYSEYLNSVYLNYSRKITDKLYVQAGLRAELANIKSDQKTQDSVYKNTYFSPYPSAIIKYSFNDKNQLQLSYSRRVNRPGPWVLNPFINYTDPLNLSAGNPSLKPEYSNSLELGYTLQLGNTTLSPSVYYRNTSGVISRIMTVYPNGTSFTTFRNQNKAEAYGLEFIVTQQVLQWWRLNGNFSYFHSALMGPDVTGDNSSSNSWTLRFMSMMMIPGVFDLQLSFNYNSPVIFNPSVGGGRMGGPGGGGGFFMMGSQGRMSENYWADAGLKKDILSGKGTISIRLSDIFKTQKYNITTFGDNFISEAKRTRDSRVLFVGFSYKFNDYKRRQQRLQDTIDEAESYN
ncbi:MAG: TonB-dependent receptor [Bacteroidales bacterium]|nr:TonB-dependent receptor [Bacteroidales bacterium]